MCIVWNRWASVYRCDDVGFLLWPIKQRKRVFHNQTILSSHSIRAFDLSSMCCDIFTCWINTFTFLNYTRVCYSSNNIHSVTYCELHLHFCGRFPCLHIFSMISFRFTIHFGEPQNMNNKRNLYVIRIFFNNNTQNFAVY